jgi:hypothetical protein
LVEWPNGHIETTGKNNGDTMKNLTISILTILILTLTACGGASNTPQADPDQLNDTYENALPVSTQLLIGTFKLEGTDLAVTSEQAGELISLWQVLQSLSSSDSTAQAEMDALIEQIQETMTPEQIQSIKDMNLTPQDMFTTMQEQGIGGQDGQNFIRPGSENGEGGELPAPPAGEGGQFFVGPGGGEPGAGGPGGGGPGGFGGQGLSPDQIATAQALREENGGGFRFTGAPAPLIEALIQFLQEKAGS